MAWDEFSYTIVGWLVASLLILLFLGWLDGPHFLWYKSLCAFMIKLEIMDLVKRRTNNRVFVGEQVQMLLCIKEKVDGWTFCNSFKAALKL